MVELLHPLNRYAFSIIDEPFCFLMLLIMVSHQSFYSHFKSAPC